MCPTWWVDPDRVSIRTVYKAVLQNSVWILFSPVNIVIFLILDFLWIQSGKSHRKWEVLFSTVWIHRGLIKFTPIDGMFSRVDWGVRIEGGIQHSKCSFFILLFYFYFYELSQNMGLIWARWCEVIRRDGEQCDQEELTKLSFFCLSLYHLASYTRRLTTRLTQKSPPFTHLNQQPKSNPISDLKTSSHFWNLNWVCHIFKPRIEP